MFRISLLFSLLFFAFGLQATTLDSLIVNLRIDEQKNILYVTETFYLPASETMPNWHRPIYHKGIQGYPLLYQRLQNIKLTDATGKEFPLKIYGYGRERTHIDFQAGELKGTCVLTYEILHPFASSDKFYYQQPYYDFPFATQKVVVDLELPSNISLKDSNWDLSYYEEKEGGQFGYQNEQKMQVIGANRYRMTPKSLDGFKSVFDIMLEGDLTFSQTLALAPPTTYQEEWKEQGGSIWWVVLGALIVAFSLRFAAPSTYPSAVRFYGLILLGLVFVVGIPLYSFFWQGGGGENFFMEFAAQIGFLIFFAMMAYTIHQNLSKLNAQAYYGVMAFPFLLLLVLLSASVHPPFYLLVPLAFAPMIFWFQQKNADYLGATYYRLIEQVETAGKMSFADLSRSANLSTDRLVEIIKNIPHHPILIDHEAKEFLSAEALALQQKHSLCNNCGAATEISNEDMVECKHCHTAYRDSRQKKSSKPVPEMVEIAAEIIKTVASWFLVLCVLMVFAMGVDWLTHGVDNLEEDLIGLVVLLVVFGGLGGWLIASTDSLKTGESSFSKWLLLPLSIFITPAILLYNFFTNKRIQLHFDKNAVQTIDAYLQQKGTATMNELAQHLHIDKKEALELADYLCGNNLVQAVFDVEKNRIVHRTVWEKLKGVNSCNSCGGLLQIKGTETECMHCGSSRKS